MQPWLAWTPAFCNFLDGLDFLFHIFYLPKHAFHCIFGLVQIYFIVFHWISVPEICPREVRHAQFSAPKICRRREWGTHSCQQRVTVCAHCCVRLRYANGGSGTQNFPCLRNANSELGTHCSWLRYATGQKDMPTAEFQYASIPFCA